MSGLSLLNGVRVLEVAQLAPAALGGHLADLGAEVIKVATRCEWEAVVPSEALTARHSCTCAGTGARNRSPSICAHPQGDRPSSM
jgi:crotonobetainyl-CoA:carnitine CoA-transferase CaiB-like acyl-CoA transferase